MTSVLKIPFVLDSGKKLTLSLQDPKSGLTQQECTVFQEYVLNNDVISYGGYEAVSYESCYLYNTNEVEVSS